MIERISPPGAPAPRGPYSPAVRAGDTIYVAGQISVDAISGKVISGDVQVETRQVLTNIKNILEGCGSSLSQVVRCGVYLTDMAWFDQMNAAYMEMFPEPRPARTTIGVASLPGGIRVEIDCVALLPPA